MFFAILSNQRSGSGWFETLLNSHINVSSNGEIFSVKERRENASSILQTLDRVYNLDWFSSASKNDCSAATGLKWMLNQVYILPVKSSEKCYQQIPTCLDINVSPHAWAICGIFAKEPVMKLWLIICQGIAYGFCLCLWWVSLVLHTLAWRLTDCLDFPLNCS